ncbi:hypothetical protein BPUTEOMOX_182 [methanotrophic endosymbiont of Bathymodiolus puteoserpentis (Logatchev)]|jgi:hypothetical protein|nr:hypothetical protein BPUTEOMOX_182 [methanotrophic endosymbiont of Bathymodiolus puteoserpentis (Logatchev)]
MINEIHKTDIVSAIELNMRSLNDEIVIAIEESTKCEIKRTYIKKFAALILMDNSEYYYKLIPKIKIELGINWSEDKHLKAIDASLVNLSIAYFFMRVSYIALEQEGEVTEAINYMNDAAISFGEYLGVTREIENYSQERKEIAKKASKAKHKVSSAYKETVINHYLSNNFKSKEQAAEKIKSELNLSYATRTIRTWLINV